MRIILLFLLITFTIFACSKEEDGSTVNPYNDDNHNPPEDSTDDFTADSSSFQFLYYKVFAPTCANSGCHDGNFQPDFRTIYSSYNTLVKHSVIQNDAQESFEYRVEPYKVEKSLLHERLTAFMPNTSGIMPLEADSNWNNDSSVYKKLIFDWILRGAPDPYGNIPADANLKPQVMGIMAFPSGNTTNPYLRLSGSTSPISIPPALALDVWFAFSDDKTNASDFKMTKLKSSYELFDFNSATGYTLSGGGSIPGKDLWNNNVTFTHKATLNFPSDTIGTYIHLRTYTRDGDQADTTEIPSDGTNDIMRSYFTLKVDSL